jgi:hypothetical protein
MILSKIIGLITIILILLNCQVSLSQHKFDNQGNLIIYSSINYRFTTFHDSIPNVKKTYNYHLNEKKTISLIFSWDSKVKIWKITAKNEIISDKRGNEISNKIYYQNPSNLQWQLSNELPDEGPISFEALYDSMNNEVLRIDADYLKKEMTYYPNGLKESEIQYRKERNSNYWKPEEKAVNIYDNRKNKLAYISYEWIDESRWFEKDRFENFYNKYGVKIGSKDTWNNSDGWFCRFDSAIKLDLNENPLRRIGYSLNTKTNTWHKDWMVDNTFDLSNNCTSYTGHSWDTIQNQWVNRSKCETKFNGFSHKTSETFYDWNNQLKKWVAKNRYDYIYDKEAKQDERISFYSYDTITNQLKCEWKTDFKEDTIRKIKNKVTYYWDLKTDKCTNRCEETKLYDNLGNIILESKFYLFISLMELNNSEKTYYYYKKK